MKSFLYKYFMIILMFSVMQIPLYAVDLKNDKKIYLSISEELSEIREMIELYVAIGEGLKYKNPKERLKETITKCNTLIKTLRKHYPKSSKNQSVDLCEASWRVIQENIASALTLTDVNQMKKEILYIHANLFKLKKSLLAIKKMLQPQMKKETKASLMASTVVGSAARTLSAHYYMEMWELDDPTINDHWKKAVKKYEVSLEILNSSKFAKNKQFKKLLAGTRKDLLFFKVLWGLKQRSYAPSLISRKSKHAHRNAIEMEKIILSTLSE